MLIDGQEFEIPVIAGDAITEILLGSRWLMNMPLGRVTFRDGLADFGVLTPGGIDRDWSQ
ncbi:MAG: hypothetical protein U7123_22150 [Potamolinea sp.]